MAENILPCPLPPAVSKMFRAQHAGHVIMAHTSTVGSCIGLWARQPPCTADTALAHTRGSPVTATTQRRA
jgi:hypothetical protein